MVIFSLGTVSPALATDEKKEIPVELKFIGNIGDKPVFQLSFNNPEDNAFVITVRDQFNNVLYKDIIKGDNSRKFMLNTDELGDEAAVSFEITGKKSDQAVVYEVNKKSRMIQDVVISRK
jgi:hypothetical protein